MNDRDSLIELFDIVYDIAEKKNLKNSLLALSFIRNSIGGEADVFLRRRLSVARMLLGFHLPESNKMVDTLITVVLSNSMPVDTVPNNFRETMNGILEKDKVAQDIFENLHQADYSNESYYEKLVKDKYALLIRLTERGVLFEALYDWGPLQAREFIRQTKENFFSMCIYGRDHYSDLIGVFTILMEKTRNLLQTNEVMLNRYEEASNNLDLEILSLTEENSLMKRIIEEYENVS